MNTVVIVIDSTEYKRDRGLNKEDISLIKDLGNKELIELHIPWFVYKECMSTCVNDISIELNKTQNLLKSFGRKGLNEPEDIQSKRIARLVAKLQNEVNQSTENLWKDFVQSSKATLYDYDEKDSVDVFKNYFEGGKPFQSLKNRNDIPDAFIYLTIKKISSNNVLHLVSEDKNLATKCEDDNNIIVYSSLKELFNHSNFLEINVQYQQLKEDEKIEQAKQVILNNIENIEDAVRRYTRKINYLTFEDNRLRSDNGEANIYAIDNPQLSIEEDKIKYIGTEFFVPIEVEGTASIDYAVFKSDYWIYYDDLPGIEEDLNKHYYLLADVVKIVMKKTLRFDIKDINEDEGLDVEIDEFDDIKIKK